MPRKVTTLKDVQRGAILRVQGKTFLQVAIDLTEDNLKEMAIPDELRNIISEINRNRTAGDTITVILKKIDDLYQMDNITKERLRDHIVGIQRITWLAKSQPWKEYTAAYQKTAQKQFFDNLDNKE